LGADLGCRVVTVGGDPETVPTELDDVADGHVSDIEQPLADDILGGDRVRVKPDGTATEPRAPKRQKCQ
jgi:hypothetical protein